MEKEKLNEKIKVLYNNELSQKEAQEAVENAIEFLTLLIKVDRERNVA